MDRASLAQRLRVLDTERLGALARGLTLPWLLSVAEAKRVGHDGWPWQYGGLLLGTRKWEDRFPTATTGSSAAMLVHCAGIDLSLPARS